MKAVIVNCIHDFVVEKFRNDFYANAAKLAGIETDKKFINAADIEDEKAINLFHELSKQLNMTLQQLFDAFGDYWVNTFSQKNYKAYYKTSNTSKNFLMAMDRVHQNTVWTMGGSNPPRFEYEDRGHSLVIKYRSKRALIGLLIGLIKGVGKYYNEDLTVKKIDENTVEVFFSNILM